MGFILEESELNTFLVVKGGEAVSQPRDLYLGARKYRILSGVLSSGEVILWGSDQTWSFFCEVHSGQRLSVMEWSSKCGGWKIRGSIR